MKLNALALALALTAASSQAMAYTQDLGTLNESGTEFAKGFVRYFGLGSPLGNFTDYYTFNIGPASTAAGGVVSFDFGFVDLQLKSISLFATGTDPSQGTTFNTPGSFTFSSLVPNGAYTLAVSGTLLSNKWLDLGGAYYEGSIRSIASAAPEPESLALLLAGLMAVVAMTRRSRNS